MKRLWIAAAVLLLIVMTAGCGKEDTSVSSNAKDAGDTATTAAQAPTDAPYIDTQLNEPEWTYPEGDLQLEDGSNVYASGEDILCFAFVTNNDGTQELRFRFSDETASVLKSQSSDNAYFMTLNGEKIGDATLNDDCNEATVTQEDSVGDITQNASKIRGLSE